MRQSLILAILPLAVAETLVWSTLYYSFPALLPAWEADLGWSRGELSGAFTASVTVMALAAPRAGRLIDRGHSTAMFLGAIVAGAVLLVALSMVQKLWQFWAVWIAIGLVNACILYEACFAIVTVVLGAQARKGITVITLVAGFAGTVSFPAAYALTEAFDWRTAVLVFCGITVLVSLPLAWIGLRALEHHREPPAERPPQTGREGREALRKLAFWGMALAFGMTGLVHGMMISHILPILGDAGLAARTAVLVASMIGPMQVLGRVAMVVTQNRVHTFGAALGAFAGMMLGLVLLLSAGVEPWLAMAFVVPYGAAYGVFSIVRPVLTAELLGRAGFGVISGMIAVPYVLGGAVGPVLAAWLWEWQGYDLMLQLSLVMGAVGIAAVIVARRAA